jgi:hypothetical protein
MASAALSANFCGDDSRNLDLLVSRNELARCISKALNVHVGRGRRYSVKQLAEGSGVPERLIECAKINPDGRNAGEHRMLKPEEIASLASFLRAPFVSAWLETIGIGAFELMDGQIPLPKVLASADVQESPEDERRRLIRRLAELEGL